MLRQKAVGGSPSASPPFPTARIAGTRSRSPSPVLRETPLSRTMTQSPDSFLSDLPLSSVPSRPWSPTSFPSLDVGTNYGETNTVHDQLGVVSPTGEIAIDENDIIIAVMGPTGAGKSTFIDRAVGRPDIGAGHGLASCTKEIRAVRYPHPDGERNIVLVDTPGFDDTFVSDTQILRKVAEWLKTTYKRKALLSGLLYFHRISDNRVAGTPLRNLNMFKELCGKDNFKNVVLVTTMWDQVVEDVGLRHEQELQNDFWRSMIRLGSTTHRFHHTEESAWEIINTLSVSPPGERRPLQIQREMVDEDKPLHKTSAGQAVLRSISDIFSGIKGFFRRSSKGSKRKMNTQDEVPLRPHHHIPRSPSSSSISSHASLSSMFASNSESGLTTDTSISGSSVTLSEHSYRTALGNVITTLKLAQSVVEFVRIHCLKEAIAPSLRIALAVEAMEGAHRGLFQVVENAALLIGVITEHAQKARLNSEVKMAISGFAKDLKRVDGIVQNMSRTQARDTLQDADFRTLLSCADSMRHACDVLRPKLSPDNRPALYRIDVGLAAVITMLEYNRNRSEML